VSPRHDAQAIAASEKRGEPDFANETGGSGGRRAAGAAGGGATLTGEGGGKGRAEPGQDRRRHVRRKDQTNAARPHLVQADGTDGALCLLAGLEVGRLAGMPGARGVALSCSCGEQRLVERLSRGMKIQSPEEDDRREEKGPAGSPSDHGRRS